jgi:hypothetical protein
MNDTATSVVSVFVRRNGFGRPTRVMNAVGVDDRPEAPADPLGEARDA